MMVVTNGSLKMINTIELTRQTHNVSLKQDIDAFKGQLSKNVQEHAFILFKGMKIGQIANKLKRLERKLL